MCVLLFTYVMSNTVCSDVILMIAVITILWSIFIIFLKTLGQTVGGVYAHAYVMLNPAWLAFRDSKVEQDGYAISVRPP